MTFIPFPAYMPDQPDFHNPGSALIKNVVPRTDKSYGPMGTFAGTTAALVASCQGAYAFMDAAGTSHIFAGDKTKLYKLSDKTLAFNDVSKSGGYNTPGLGSAPVSTAGFWSVTSYGERIVATNFADPPQTFLVSGDTAFSDLAGALTPAGATYPPGFGQAPRGRYAAVIRDFLFLANLDDPISGRRPHRVQWSAIGAPQSWPIPGTNTAVSTQSDFQDLQQTDLGHITGIIGGGLSAADGAIFCERGIYRVAYAGSPAIFDFVVAQGAAGTQSPLSIVQRRVQSQRSGSHTVCYYLGTDGFYYFDGLTALPIGNNRVDKTFFADANPMFVNYIQGAADPTSKLLFWVYASNAVTSETAPFDRMLVYNWDVDRWSFVDLTATPAEWLVMAITPGYSLDQLDTFGTLDTLPHPLDSRYWMGGFPAIGIFDASNKLALSFGTSAMAATLETNEIEPVPGKRVKLVGARPIYEGGGTASVATGHRDRPFDAVTYESAVAVDGIGNCPQRCTGRHVRFRLTLPAAAAFTHISGVDVDMRPEGKR